MHTVYLSIGSNLGNRFETLQSAVNKIQNRVGKVISTSKIYESEPLGFVSSDQFLNACIGVKTNLTAENLLNAIHKIEFEAGRIRLTTGVYTSRPLDIDIIFYDQLIIETNQLKIPHLHYKNRLFVLIPLSEIIPNYSDPICGKNIIELISKCTDNSKLFPYKTPLTI